MLNLILAIMLLQPVQSVQSVTNPPAMAVSPEEAALHLIGEQPIVRAKAVSPGKLFLATVRVDVLVDKKGAVLSATAVPPSDNDFAVSETGLSKLTPDILAEAETVVSKLHFAEFKSGDRAVAVTFQQYVQVLPPELTPANHIPVPVVRNWNSVTISLQRTSCFGRCPAYRLVIRGDGSVDYDGHAFVAAKGLQFGSMPREKIAELIAIIERADFYSLQDVYGGCGSDASDAYLRVEIEGHSKEVRDCMGEWHGMPHSVAQLELAIDRLSGVETWIHPQTFLNGYEVFP